MAFVQGDKGSTTGATTVANAGITTTTGNFLCCVISIVSTSTLSSITDTFGNTWVAATSNTQTTTGVNIYVYWAVNITGGASHQVTAHLSTSNGAAISVAEFSGRSTSSPILVQQALIEGTRTTIHTSAATGTLSQSSCDVICLAADSAFNDFGGNETYTPGGSWVLPAAANVNTAGTTPTAYILYQNAVATTSQTATWTSSGGTITAASVILALAPAASGGSAVTAWWV